MATALNDAQRLTVSENIKLAGYIASKYIKNASSYNADADDFQDAAYFGLMKAAATYDPNNAQGANFATYAVFIMHNECKLVIRRTKVRDKIKAYSFDFVINLNTDSDCAATLADVTREFRAGLSTDYGATHIDNTKASILACMNEVLNSLAPLSKRVMEIYWTYRMNELDIKQRTLAELCGCSQSYCARIIMRAKTELKHKCIEAGIM